MSAIDRILCPVDFSECSRHALEYAVAMARQYGARLTVLHVFADIPVVAPVPPGFEGSMAVSLSNVDRDAIAAAAERFVATVPADGIAIDREVVEALDTGAAITEFGESLPASAIVMGTHGRSAPARLLLGSTAAKVLRSSRRPVITVPPRATGHAPAIPFRRLLCPVDFSDASLLALEWARRRAEESGGHLTVLHVIELPPELHELPLGVEGDVEKIRAETASHCRRRLDALVPASVRASGAVVTRVVEGRAHAEILRHAAGDRADVIVMGIRGRGPLRTALFGSNTNAVLHEAECPVVTVKP